jgi:hypothetical protein
MDAAEWWLDFRKRRQAAPAHTADAAQTSA